MNEMYINAVNWGGKLIEFPYTKGISSSKLISLYKEIGTTPKRIEVFNLWRRFDKDGTDTPFAVCDKRTVSEKELIPTDLFNYIGDEPQGLTVEIYQSAHNQDHKWYFYPKMNRDEVLMFKTYDSLDNPFLPTLHSAFDDTSAKKNASPRESIEVRAVCLYN